MFSILILFYVFVIMYVSHSHSYSWYRLLFMEFFSLFLSFSQLIWMNVVIYFQKFKLWFIFHSVKPDQRVEEWSMCRKYVWYQAFCVVVGDIEYVFYRWRNGRHSTERFASALLVELRPIHLARRMIMTFHGKYLGKMPISIISEIKIINIFA